MALHAGALEVRPDLPPAQVADAAGLIRATARQALEELRAAIGVLRDGAGDSEPPRAPRPSPGDITLLVRESRQAGLPHRGQDRDPDRVLGLTPPDHPILASKPAESFEGILERGSPHDRPSTGRRVRTIGAWAG